MRMCHVAQTWVSMWYPFIGSLVVKLFDSVRFQTMTSDVGEHLGRVGRARTPSLYVLTIYGAKNI
jgi:hypothetical protein